MLELLLAPVRVAVPARLSPRQPAPCGRPWRRREHDAAEVDVAAMLEAYLASGLPATTMGRSVAEDRDFFRAGSPEAPSWRGW